jgi:hypothetical protein
MPWGGSWNCALFKEADVAHDERGKWLGPSGCLGGHEGSRPRDVDDIEDANAFEFKTEQPISTRSRHLFETECFENRSVSASRRNPSWAQGGRAFKSPRPDHSKQ